MVHRVKFLNLAASKKFPTRIMLKVSSPEATWSMLTVLSRIILHSKKRTTCSGLMKTALNNVLLPTLFKVVNNTEQVDEPELACNQV